MQRKNCQSVEMSKRFPKMTLGFRMVKMAAITISFHSGKVALFCLLLSKNSPQKYSLSRMVRDGLMDLEPIINRCFKLRLKCKRVHGETSDSLF